MTMCTFSGMSVLVESVLLLSHRLLSLVHCAADDTLSVLILCLARDETPQKMRWKCQASKAREKAA